eukprot:gene2507-2861_t
MSDDMHLPVGGTPPHKGAEPFTQMSYAQTDEMITDPSQIQSKRNFGNQFNALFRKSSTYQWRQYKTNICQISLPLLLIILLFVLQTIVSNFVKDQDGAKIPSELHKPSNLPALYEFNGTIVEDCSKFYNLFDKPYARSLSYVDEKSQAYVEQMVANISGFVANNEAKVPLIYAQSFFGSFATYCSNAPSRVNPLSMTRVLTYDEFTNQTFDDWKTQSILGGYNFGTVDDNTLEASLLYNKSLSFGRDLGTLYTLATRAYLLVTGKNITQIIFVFFGKTNTATVVGYIWVFGTGILSARVIDNILGQDSTPASSVFVISIIPPFVLYRGLLVLKDHVSFFGPGVQIDTLNDPGYQLGEVYAFMVVEAIIFLILALYLEEVFPSEYGVKRHPLFFLKRSFWTGKKKEQVQVTLKPTMEGEAHDVAAERTRVIQSKQLLALEVLDLNKVYPAQGGGKRKVAVKSLALGVDQGICFGFLGPNGAGKSTTISCVSGLFPPTEGTAKVFGMDIRDEIDNIHMIMGVCPQDNVLWDDLTGEEHLLFYGRIKNMKGKELTDAVYNGLKQVNLHEETSKKSGEYSGGMRRRLSVACSLMGNPKIVLLDEPSTGLDPASRKQLWDIINNYKRKCAMLLTTHAMEEADALCDRLGLFVSGELKCIGTSSELKSRFGKGYKVTMSVQAGYEAEAQKFLHSQIPSANLLNALAGTFNYEVPRTSVELSVLFAAFEQNKERLHISDWGISNSTLEEVFIKITMGKQNEKGEYVLDERGSVDLSHITNA